MSMEWSIKESEILKGVFIIEPNTFCDSRGVICSVFEEGVLGGLLPLNFVLDKFTLSRPNVLRGIHGDHKSYKLVTCVRGEVQQVVVDCREESPSYLRWESFRLCFEEPRLILIPPRFGNAHYVVSDEDALYYYKIAYEGAYVDAGEQFTYAWDDARIGIEWRLRGGGGVRAHPLRAGSIGREGEMRPDAKIYIAGHRGTAGSAILRRLQEEGFHNILTRTHAELDLTRQAEVEEFFVKERPEFVFFAAVLPCGAANVAQRGDFLYENSMMQNNILHSSLKFGVKKLIFFGSAYMYPKEAQIPLKEEDLLQGELEWGAASFGVAKIAGALLCESYNLQYGTQFFALVCPNLYGPQAAFSLAKSRVLPALLRKMHLAKLLREGDEAGVLADLWERDGLELHTLSAAAAHLAKFGVSRESVEIWGTGKVVREFLHADDLADASLFVMENVEFKDLVSAQSEVKNTHINVGTGESHSIGALAEVVREVVGFLGDLEFNPTKPDSTMDRLLDCSKIHALGWRHKIELREGIAKMYAAYKNLNLRRK